MIDNYNKINSIIKNNNNNLKAYKIIRGNV